MSQSDRQVSKRFSFGRDTHNTRRWTSYNTLTNTQKGGTSYTHIPSERTLSSSESIWIHRKKGGGNGKRKGVKKGGKEGGDKQPKGGEGTHSHTAPSFLLLLLLGVRARTNDHGTIDSDWTELDLDLIQVSLLVSACGRRGATGGIVFPSDRRGSYRRAGKGGGEDRREKGRSKGAPGQQEEAPQSKVGSLSLGKEGGTSKFPLCPLSLLPPAFCFGDHPNEKKK